MRALTADVLAAVKSLPAGACPTSATLDRAFTACLYNNADGGRLRHTDSLGLVLGLVGCTLQYGYWPRAFVARGLDHAIHDARKPLLLQHHECGLLLELACDTCAPGLSYVPHLQRALLQAPKQALAAAARDPAGSRAQAPPLDILIAGWSASCCSSPAVPHQASASSGLKLGEDARRGMLQRAETYLAKVHGHQYVPVLGDGAGSSSDDADRAQSVKEGDVPATSDVLEFAAAAHDAPPVLGAQHAHALLDHVICLTSARLADWQQQQQQQQGALGQGGAGEEAREAEEAAGLAWPNCPRIYRALKSRAGTPELQWRLLALYRLCRSPRAALLAPKVLAACAGADHPEVLTQAVLLAAQHGVLCPALARAVAVVSQRLHWFSDTQLMAMVGPLHRLALLQAEQQQAAQRSRTSLTVDPALLLLGGTRGLKGSTGSSSSSADEPGAVPLEVLLAAGAEAGPQQANTKAPAVSAPRHMHPAQGASVDQDPSLDLAARIGLRIAGYLAGPASAGTAALRQQLGMGGAKG